MSAAPLVRTGIDALPQAFAKLDPRHTVRSPVMFVVVIFRSPPWPPRRSHSASENP